MSFYKTKTWAPLSPLAHWRVVEIRAKLEATRARFTPRTSSQEPFVIVGYGEYAPVKHAPDYGDGEIYGEDGLPELWPDRHEDLLAPEEEEEHAECCYHARVFRPMSEESHNVVFSVSGVKPVDTDAFVKSALAGRYSV